MERLTQKQIDLERALGTLEAILEEPFSVIVRDATIQRFEYTFEAFWKWTQEYLKQQEGVIANSPKTCFKDLYKAGLCSAPESVKLLEMTDKRNATTHTYREKIAKMIYRSIRGYQQLIRKIHSRATAKH